MLARLRFPSALTNRFSFLVLLWIAALVLVSSLSPYFLQASTVPYLLQYIPVLGLLGIGQTLVMLAGGPGIDISVGSMLSLIAVFIGWLAGGVGVPIVVACLLGILLGALLGLINGLMVNFLNIAALMATLATYFAYSGLALALTGGRPQTGFPESFSWLGAQGLWGIPNQFLFVFVPIAIIAHIALSRTKVGNHIYACGTNEEAARLNGVRVKLLRTCLYTLSGVMAALGAIITCAWFMSARPDAGLGMELLAVTIAVLGGTHIFGGEGDIRGTVIAIFVVTTLQIGLQLAGVSQAWQLGVVGLLLVGTVSSTYFLHVLRARAA